jgi:glutathione S-transferase
VRHRLITIPFSHFCEKARWALDVAGVPYREEGHTPVLHRRAVLRAGGRGTVPVLVTSDGRVLDDSPLIVRFADDAAPADSKLLPPEGPRRDDALALERELDTELGPHIRRYVYCHGLPRRDLALEQFRRHVPAMEARIVTALFPLVRVFMKRYMRVTKDRALDSRERTFRVFDDVGRRLADGRPFLLGDRFGVADIAFASLAAPLVVPPEHPRFQVNESTAPEELRADRRELSASAAGDFARRLYREHRGVRPVTG